MALKWSAEVCFHKCWLLHSRIWLLFTSKAAFIFVLVLLKIHRVRMWRWRQRRQPSNAVSSFHSLLQKATCLWHLRAECTEHRSASPRASELKASVHKRLPFTRTRFMPFGDLFHGCTLCTAPLAPTRRCKLAATPKGLGAALACGGLGATSPSPFVFSSWRRRARAPAEPPYGCFCFGVHKRSWPQPAECPVASQSPFFFPCCLCQRKKAAAWARSGAKLCVLDGQHHALSGAREGPSLYPGLVTAGVWGSGGTGMKQHRAQNKHTERYWGKKTSF